MLRSFTSICLLVCAILFSQLVKAQENAYAIAEDSTTTKSAMWKPTGLRIGVDLLSPILGAFDDSRNGWNFIADIDFKNFFLVLEGGFASDNESGIRSNYSSDGAFMKIGPDVNLLARDDKLHVFFFGLRYASATYNETLMGSEANLTWGQTDIDLEQKGQSSSWIEMNTGLKVRLWKGLFTGYALRFKFARFSDTTDQQFETYFVPGYGLASRSNNWEFDYYIFYRFQWKKKPIKWKAQ